MKRHSHVFSRPSYLFRYPYSIFRNMSMEKYDVSRIPLEDLKIEGQADLHSEEEHNQTSQAKGLKIKKRKPQSEEDFAQQKQVYKDGPPIQNIDWFDKLDLAHFKDVSIKIDRGAVLHAAERAFFMRDYGRALEVLQLTDDWKMNDKQRSEVNRIREASEKKLSDKTQSEDTKVTE